MAQNNRIKTHIKGFDSLIEGGFPVGSRVLISGTAGTGKTIFSLQYLYNGAIHDNEMGVYFTFEEKKEALYEQAKQFGWDFKKLESKGLIKIISIGTEDITKTTMRDIVDIVKNTKAKRVVIDSLTTLVYLCSSFNSGQTQVNEQHNIKKFLYSFLAYFNEFKNLTCIFISQKDEKLSNIVAQYMCDGVVKIDYESIGGDFSRNITIRKMRKTKNSDNLYPLEISNDGITIHEI